MSLPSNCDSAMAGAVNLLSKQTAVIENELLRISKSLDKLSEDFSAYKQYLLDREEMQQRQINDLTIEVHRSVSFSKGAAWLIGLALTVAGFVIGIVK